MYSPMLYHGTRVQDRLVHSGVVPYKPLITYGTIEVYCGTCWQCWYILSAMLDTCGIIVLNTCHMGVA